MNPNRVITVKSLGDLFEPSAYSGRNASGVFPVNDLVLVMPDKAKEKHGSVILADVTKDNAQLASEMGVLVAVGEGAFNWSRDRMREWVGTKPKPGDRVIYQRYSGALYIGLDGLPYRLMGDKEIAAIQIEDAPENPAKTEAPEVASPGAILTAGATVTA